MSEYLVTPDGRKWIPEGVTPPQPPPTGKHLFRVKHDAEIAGEQEPGFTPRLSVPEVYWLSNTGFPLTRAMQELSYGLFLWGAPSLPLYYSEKTIKNRWGSIWDEKKAFANKSGFGSQPPRKNYITGENVNNNDAVDPNIDKHRFGGGFTGLGEVVENYEYWNYLAEPHRFETIDVVKFDAIHPDSLPTLEELKQTPWLFFHATVARANKAGYFPNGVISEAGIYEPTLIPFFGIEPVVWPLRRCQLVDQIADPYKFYN